jgi:hypothetical protein
MNRKLNNSLLAFSVSGLLLAMGILAAHPSQPGSSVTVLDAAVADAEPAVAIATAPAAAIWTTADRTLGRAAWADAIEADAQAQQRTPGGDLRRDAYADLDGLVAAAITLGTEVSANAALAQALQASDAAQALRIAEGARRNHAHRLRSALAVPYFSFAQGLRRGAGS